MTRLKLKEVYLTKEKKDREKLKKLIINYIKRTMD